VIASIFRMDAMPGQERREIETGFDLHPRCLVADTKVTREKENPTTKN